MRTGPARRAAYRGCQLAARGVCQPRQAHPFPLRHAAARGRQLQGQLARTQAECQGPTGLTGLLASGLLRDGESLKGADISADVTYKLTGDLRPDNAASYRAGSRIAFTMSLHNKSPLAWEPREVTLRASTGAPLQVLSVWPRQPLLPGASARVVVEAATPEEALPPGPYTLTFGPEDEPSLVLERVRFP